MGSCPSTPTGIHLSPCLGCHSWTSPPPSPCHGLWSNHTEFNLVPGAPLPSSGLGLCCEQTQALLHALIPSSLQWCLHTFQKLVNHHLDFYDRVFLSHALWVAHSVLSPQPLSCFGIAAESLPLLVCQTRRSLRMDILSTLFTPLPQLLACAWTQPWLSKSALMQNVSN